MLFMVKVELNIRALHRKDNKETCNHSKSLGWNKE